MMGSIFYNGYILLLLTLASGVSSNNLPENLLRDELFKTYNAEVFPQPLNGEPLQINMSVAIRNLPELKLKEFSLVLDIIISLSWKNHQLAWNETKYPNLTGISTSKSRVWVPQLLILPERLQITATQEDEKVFIRPDGVTEWVFRRTINKECRFGLEEFPRDSHTCSFSVHTHTPGHLVDLQAVPSHVPDIKDNGVWGVTKLTKTVGIDPFHPDYGYKVQVSLKRHTGYFVKKLVRPLMIMSVLPLIGVFCPPDSGERIGFSVTSLLTLIVTLQYTLENLPESAQDPELVTASEISLFMMLAHVIISCFVVWIFFRKRNPPKWLIRLFSTKVMSVCLLGPPEKGQQSCCGQQIGEAGGSYSHKLQETSWVWRKLAILLDWLGFCAFFLLWVSKLLPIYLSKH